MPKLTTWSLDSNISASSVGINVWSNSGPTLSKYSELGDNVERRGIWFFCKELSSIPRLIKASKKEFRFKIARVSRAPINEPNSWTIIMRQPSNNGVFKVKTLPNVMAEILQKRYLFCLLCLNCFRARI